MSTSNQPLAIEVDQPTLDGMPLKTMKLEECHIIADCIEMDASGKQLLSKGRAMTESKSKEKQEEGFSLLAQGGILVDDAKKLLATYRPKMTIEDIVKKYEVDRTCKSNLLVNGKEFVPSDRWIEVANDLITTKTVTSITKFKAAWNKSKYTTNISEMVKALFPSHKNSVDGDVTALAIGGNATANRNPLAATMMQNRGSMFTQQCAEWQPWTTRAGPAQSLVKNDYHSGATVIENQTNNGYDAASVQALMKIVADAKNNGADAAEIKDLKEDIAVLNRKMDDTNNQIRNNHYQVRDTQDRLSEQVNVVVQQTVPRNRGPPPSAELERQTRGDEHRGKDEVRANVFPEPEATDKKLPYTIAADYFPNAIRAYQEFIDKLNHGKGDESRALLLKYFIEEMNASDTFLPEMRLVTNQRALGELLRNSLGAGDANVSLGTSCIVYKPEDSSEMLIYFTANRFDKNFESSARTEDDISAFDRNVVGLGMKYRIIFELFFHDDPENENHVELIVAVSDPGYVFAIASATARDVFSVVPNLKKIHLPSCFNDKRSDFYISANDISIMGLNESLRTISFRGQKFNGEQLEMLSTFDKELKFEDCRASEIDWAALFGNPQAELSIKFMDCLPSFAAVGFGEARIKGFELEKSGSGMFEVASEDIQHLTKLVRTAVRNGYKVAIIETEDDEAEQAGASFIFKSIMCKNPRIPIYPKLKEARAAALEELRIAQNLASDGIVNDGTEMDDKENIPCDGINIDCDTNIVNVDVDKKPHGDGHHIGKNTALEPKDLSIQHNLYDDAMAPKKTSAKADAQQIKESGKPHQTGPVLVGDGGNALPSTKYAKSELVEPSSKDESSSPALTGNASVLSVASTKESAKVGGSTPLKKQQGSAETFTGTIKSAGGNEILVKKGEVQVTDKNSKGSKGLRSCKRCEKNGGWNKCTVHKKTFISFMSDSNVAP